MLTHQQRNERIGIAHVLTLPIRQGFLGRASRSLLFEEEDRSRPHQRQVSRRYRMADLAVILSLRVISPVVLLALDPPILPHPVEHLLRRGLVWQTTDHTIGRLGRGLKHLALPNLLDVPVDAEDLHCSGQADRRRIHFHHPQAPLHDHSVAFVE